MNISNAASKREFQANVRTSGPLETGTTIIKRSTSERFTDANVVVVKRIELQAAECDALIDSGTGAVTTTTAPIAAQTTATCVGTITGSGNATATLTSDFLTAPIVVSVPVSNNDSNNSWALKVGGALLLNAQIAAKWDITAPYGTVVLTSKSPGIPDATLNLGITNGTCTGITPDATSTSTATGTPGTLITNPEAAWSDRFTVQHMEILVTSGVIVMTHTDCIQGLMKAGEEVLTKNIRSDIGFSAVEPSVIDIVIIGKQA